LVTLGLLWGYFGVDFELTLDWFCEVIGTLG